ncbi:MAG: hypothetical protein O7B35_11920 [Deltaproteobacteria bacterium]|nr:hypothetical protein [Deltaproteobacteria bacterium]
MGARNIRRIAILPPDPMPLGKKIQLPYSPVLSSEGKGGEKEAASILSNHLYSTMSALTHWQIISDREVREVRTMIPHGGESARARKLGELVYADAVISGRILRYRERVGKEWGAKSPASVAFVLDLWDVKRGDLIWSARFDETQKGLSENLFALGEFTQRGARWLKAEELVLEGIKKAVNQLHQTLYRRAT